MDNYLPMIYLYESAILEWINMVMPNINEALYAPKEQLLGAVTNIVHYPTFLYSREDTEQPWNKPCRIVENDGSYITVYPFLQKYKGKIIVESGLAMHQVYNLIRNQFNHYPYVFIKWAGESLKIQLRLLYIKVTDERTPEDLKGSQRAVEFGWSSQMVSDDIYEHNRYELVNEVRIEVETASGAVVTWSPYSPMYQRLKIARIYCSDTL